MDGAGPRFSYVPTSTPNGNRNMRTTTHFARKLTAALGDPGLYEAAEGAREAARLSSALGSARKELGGALAAWEAAMAAADTTV